MLNRLTRRLKRRDKAPKIRFEDLPEAQAYIVSYPKCGRTWLRLMIGRYVCQLHKLHPKLALETHHLTHRAGMLATRFDHDGSEPKGGVWQPVVTDKSRFAGKRVLFLMRDPRDVAVSCYFQATRRDKTYEGSISDYLRDDRQGVRHYLQFLDSWERNRHIPESFMVLRYRDLYADAKGRLREILTFLKCPQIEEDLLEDAVNYAAFSNMRDLEANRYFNSKRLSPGDINDIESFKVRKGKVGGFFNYLSEADVAYVNSLIVSTTCTLLAPYREQINYLRRGINVVLALMLWV